MSDDGEYYYDAEFEEFQDMLYDADPAPDLADDLADRATYSPVWQNNPTDELRDYFSDWEYYSDDYFDDDPALLATSTKREDGKGKELQSRDTRPVRQGTKRKRQDTDGPVAKRREVEALRDCFRGTVWKNTSGSQDSHVITYENGRDSPVSLVLSRDVMRSAYNKRRGFGKGAVSFKRDETWANDLSLEDMGLRTERSMSIPENPEQAMLDDEDGENEGVGDDEYSEDDQAVGDDEDMTSERLVYNAAPSNALDLADAIVDDLIEANGNASAGHGQPEIADLEVDLRVLEELVEELKGTVRRQTRRTKRTTHAIETRKESSSMKSMVARAQALSVEMEALVQGCSDEELAQLNSSGSNELAKARDLAERVIEQTNMLTHSVSTANPKSSHNSHRSANGHANAQNNGDTRHDTSAGSPNGHATQKGTRKRKFSHGEETGVTASTASNRAKRVDSKVTA